MKTFNISTLIKVILAVLCCSIIIIFAYSVVSMRAASNAFDESAKVTVNVRELSTLSETLGQIRGQINYLANSSTATHAIIDESVNVLEDALAEAKESLGHFRDYPDANPQGRELAAVIEQKFNALYDTYNGNIKSLRSYIVTGFDNEAYESAVQKAINAYTVYSSNLDKTLGDGFTSKQNVYFVISTILLLIAVAISFASYLIIKRSVFDRLEYTSDALHKIGNGELYHEIDIGARNEIGLMLESLKEMQQSLLQMIRSVRTTSEEIKLNASEIDSANINLASRTEEQASALQQTAASMEEIKTTVSNNTENARQANDLAYKARSTAESGSSVMGDVVITMDKISQSARKISEINSVIDGIANQTNILALNAAVEAARAGEQGRGFSVVATEVRNLAKRSADAAKEISVLINQSVENVDDGAKLIENAGSTMQEIVASVTQVSDIMQEITQASEEQSSGVGQISTAVNEMDYATQQNATMVEESSTIARNMNDNAKGLYDIVSVFRLHSGDVSRNDIAPRELNLSRKSMSGKVDKDHGHKKDSADAEGAWSEF